MPSLRLPLRHRSSRHNEGLRQKPRSPPPEQNPIPPSNIDFEKMLPPVQKPNFAERPVTAASSTYHPTSQGHFRPLSEVEATLPHLEDHAGVEKSADTVRNGSGPSMMERETPRTRDVNRSPTSSPPSRSSSLGAAYETQATSVDLPPLQAHSALEASDQMRPLEGDLPGSFDLVEPPSQISESFSLERRSEQLFSQEHLHIIFSSPSSLLKFTAFLSTHRPQSVPLLIYYLDALKAIKAIKYSNAVAEALVPLKGHAFTENRPAGTVNRQLEEKAALAFKAMTDHDLPAFVTQIYVQVVSLSISQRITGTLAPHLREASEGLAEVFCLTDPSRPDNPIVFASEEFHRTTQYGMNYAIGRNCRFLQGPRTSPLSPRRLGDAVRDGKEHCEVMLNYRRDGSTFMNMLMIAPLCDSRGKVRYFIGAQVDVTGLVKDCTDMQTLQQLLDRQRSPRTGQGESTRGFPLQERDDFQDLSEMLNMAELETVRKHGGKMHREFQEEEGGPSPGPNHMSRLLLQEPVTREDMAFEYGDRQGGKLSGIYQNYLLIRPYPSFRILFASPSLRLPGILQSPFMDKIGGSTRVRNELSAALAEGRGVTAKVRWLSRPDEDGRSRWIHCTPLLGSDGRVGVWMIVIVDGDQVLGRRWKQAPPVAPHRGRLYDSSSRDGSVNLRTSVESSVAGTTHAEVAAGDRYMPPPQQDPRGRKPSSAFRSPSPNPLAFD